MMRCGSASAKLTEQSVEPAIEAISDVYAHPPVALQKHLCQYLIYIYINIYCSLYIYIFKYTVVYIYIELRKYKHINKTNKYIQTIQ